MIHKDKNLTMRSCDFTDRFWYYSMIFQLVKVVFSVWKFDKNSNLKKNITKFKVLFKNNVLRTFN